MIMGSQTLFFSAFTAMAFRPELMVSFTHPGCPASLDHEALANLGKEGKEGGRDLDLDHSSGCISLVALRFLEVAYRLPQWF